VPALASTTAAATAYNAIHRTLLCRRHNDGSGGNINHLHLVLLTPAICAARRLLIK